MLCILPPRCPPAHLPVRGRQTEPESSGMLSMPGNRHALWLSGNSSITATEGPGRDATAPGRAHVAVTARRAAVCGGERQMLVGASTWTASQAHYLTNGRCKAQIARAFRRAGTLAAACHVAVQEGVTKKNEAACDHAGCQMIDESIIGSQHRVWLSARFVEVDGSLGGEPLPLIWQAWRRIRATPQTY